MKTSILVLFSVFCFAFGANPIRGPNDICQWFEPQIWLKLECPEGMYEKSQGPGRRIECCEPNTGPKPKYVCEWIEPPMWVKLECPAGQIEKNRGPGRRLECCKVVPKYNCKWFDSDGTGQIGCPIGWTETKRQKTAKGVRIQCCRP